MVIFNFIEKKMTDKKTIHEWEDELGFWVLDPDGFDRTDKDLFKRKFTKEEFLNNCAISTLEDVGKYFEVLKESKIKPECSCKKSDSWRCAKEQNSRDLACSCGCHKINI